MRNNARVTVTPGVRIDIAIGTGFVVETGIYCIYSCLFFSALPVMIRTKQRRGAHGTRSAWVFLIVSILMYLVATTHLVFAGFRFYKSLFLGIDPRGPVAYLYNFRHWEFLGLIAVLCVQTWLGDGLVIYRCYVVWGSLWFVALPICLLLGTIGMNIYVMYWLRHPHVGGLADAMRLRKSIYPLAFAQNIITTSLIVIKILLQHRASKKAGVVDVGSGLGLMRVVRIFIESAAIYTIQILVLVILSVSRNNISWIVQSAVTPSIGITFVLLALRIDSSSRRDDTTTQPVRTTLMPRWAQRSDIESSVDGEQRSIANGDRGVVDELELKSQGV